MLSPFDLVILWWVLCGAGTVLFWFIQGLGKPKKGEKLPDLSWMEIK